MRNFLFNKKLVTAAGLVASLSILLSVFSTRPAPVIAADDQAASGKMLAQSICIACHSQLVQGDPYHLDSAKLYAGGEAFEGPWGKIFSANITPDKETGIGNWTDAQIKRAINEGISADGKKLILMPWEIFRGLSDDDLNAIVAYLKTLPPIKNMVPEAQLAPPEAIAGFVGSIPPLKAAVPPALYASPRDVFHDFFFPSDPSAVPPAPAGFKAPQGKDSPARGGYLVKNLLACAACHAVNLAGGTPPFFAPNITPDRDTGIGNWSKEDMVKALREGIRPDGRRLSPVMPAGALLYGNLSDDEVYNVVAYLKSVPAVRRAPGEPNPAFPLPPGPPPGAPAALPSTGSGGLKDQQPAAGVAALAGAFLAVLAVGVLRRGRRV